MKSVFADTFYFLALLNERDQAHASALARNGMLPHCATKSGFTFPISVPAAILNP